MVQYHLNILEHDGHISRGASKSRSIRLVKEKPTAVSVPLLGVIAAGEPIPVPESGSWDTTPQEIIEVPSDLVHGLDNVFSLKVNGTSMVDALIDNGDIVLLQQAETVEDGEMAAVWLVSESETTLKRVYRNSGRIRLQPANQQMGPLYHDPKNVRIQGKVVGVIRKSQLS